MWTETDRGNGSSLSTSLHAMMSTQNHVTTYPQALNLSESFSQALKRPRTLLDSQSHRVIEKRRRDRMNNCLADLGQLVADVTDTNGIKHTGQGRIKKTEIIEMAIDRIRVLQSQIRETQGRSEDRLFQGFRECRDVAVRYLVDQHGQDVVGPLCSGLLMHLHDHLRSICRVGATHPAQIQGNKRYIDLDHGVSVDLKATPLVYGLPSSSRDNVAWQKADQIYVKPEVISPETAAFGDDELVSVVNNLASSSLVQPASRPRRISETINESGAKGEKASIYVVTSDDGGDEICWNGGVASNEEDDEDSAGSMSQRHLRQSKQRQHQIQHRMNGGYKYKDSIKRRFCSESDARSWNESASDCSSTVGGGGSSRYSTIEVNGREAEAGGGVGISETGTDAVASPPSSPADQVNPEPSTAVSQPQNVAPATTRLTAKFAFRSCRCSNDRSSTSVANQSTPGFVLHQSGSYYLPVFVSFPWRRRKTTESAESNRTGNGDSDDGCCDDDDDDDEEEETKAHQVPDDVTCHPVNIPVNLNSGSVPVICGCTAATRRLDKSARRRVVSEPPAPTSVYGVDIPMGNVSRRFPSAPVLLNRV